jgi:homoserine dehydrogenase
LLAPAGGGKFRSVMQSINFGMIGGGTVGSGVCHHLQRNGPLLAARLGVQVNLRRVAVKALEEPRPYPIPRDLLTTDWEQVVHDPQVQVVIELVGGTGLAREIILSALRLGKPVITANKALLSKHGQELFAAAREHGANLYYEASVAGGIPIIKVIREAFAGNHFPAIYGIVNGTCNYILTRMKREGADFATVLADAQQQGYAETPPDLDIDGWDSAHKLHLLASLAHGFWINANEMHVEGIRAVSQADIRFADQLGYTIKLLGCVKQVDRRQPASRGRKSPGGPQVQVSVYPALIPKGHVLASVNDVFNAVFVRGDVVGDTLFYGRGAGKDATASAVLSDIADAALDLAHGSPGRVPAFVAHECGGAVVPLDQVASRYYVRLGVVDKPGVFAKISGILAQSGIGISSIIQPEGNEGDIVPVILMIHDAPNAAMRKALGKITRLPAVKTAPVMIRVEDFV